jgi:sporulation protein YlmC with PRC-barrel domain
MLDKAKTLTGYKLEGKDGEFGTVKELLFDDQLWTIRYLVAETGSWLLERHVLISPYALTAVLRDAQRITLNLTKKQIEESPLLSSDKPVTRQFEHSYNLYYGWPMYWNGPYAWGSYPFPFLPPENVELFKVLTPEKAWDIHLCSSMDMSGYHIHATDGEIGHVEDFIIDDKTWTIRYLIVDTQNWWPGKKVLISPKWIEDVSVSDSNISVSLSRDAIKESPEYTGLDDLTREYEVELHEHYSREGYWNDNAEPANHPR